MRTLPSLIKLDKVYKPLLNGGQKVRHLRVNSISSNRSRIVLDSEEVRNLEQKFDGGFDRLNKSNEMSVDSLNTYSNSHLKLAAVIPANKIDHFLSQPVTNFTATATGEKLADKNLNTITTWHSSANSYDYFRRKRDVLRSERDNISTLVDFQLEHTSVFNTHNRSTLIDPKRSEKSSQNSKPSLRLPLYKVSQGQIERSRLKEVSNREKSLMLERVSLFEKSESKNA
jgi:hypothetical protein